MFSRNLPRYNENAGGDDGPRTHFYNGNREARSAGNDISTVEKNRLKSCKITEKGIVYVSHSDF